MPNMMVRSLQPSIRNHLLRTMPPEVLDHLLPQAERIPLVIRTVLLLPDQAADHVYFIESGSVSMIATLASGGQVEVGLVGREGFVGLPVLLGAPTSSIEALVQAEGSALRMPAAAFRRVMTELPSMLAPMLRYVDAFLAQVTQAVICNTHHRVEQRLARWILMTQDRVGSDTFTMTQQFMSYMLGAQRPSVTLTVGTLQRAGLIRHGRAKMQVLDRPGLEAVACECYDVVRQRFAWMDSQGEGKDEFPSPLT